MERSQPYLAVDILSDDDDAPSALLPPPRRSKRNSSGNVSGHCGGGGGSTFPFLVIDDDPTPQKPHPARTSSLVSETLLSIEIDASIAKCSNARTNSREKFAGINSFICLESDNESDSGANGGIFTESGLMLKEHEKEGCLSSFLRPEHSRLDSPSKNEHDGLFSQINDVACENELEVATTTTKFGSSDVYTGISDFIKISGRSLSHDDCLADDLDAQEDNVDGDSSYLCQSLSAVKQTGKKRALVADSNILKIETAARKKQFKEEKVHLIEERKQKRQDEKLRKEAMKAEAGELKKLEKEKQKWEKGKLALKSIIAEIDAKVLENGSIGGHILTRFAEKGLSYRITSNPIERSVLWKMSVPENIAQLSSTTSDVPYILLLYQAKEFCDLVISESLIDHVHTVRSKFPLFTICYLTNKLMSFINKCEQNHYKNSSDSSEWMRPPVEEALSKLSTHFSKVHSRQCIDEAEIADHIVGLTSSLASCQFKKKLTWLSVNANGSMVSKDFIDKKLIKNNVWLRALVAIPKVQPRHAVAIWKKYPTMRSLLGVYMNSGLSVHEKEFLLKDLMVEGLLGREDRRLGEACSKRIFRILMAQSGGIRTDDVEDGADFFRC